MSSRISATIAILMAAAVSISAGCGSSGDTANEPGMAEVASQLDAQTAAQKQQEQANSQPAAQPEATETAPAEPERKVAGRSDIGQGGYLTAIAGARRHVLNRVEGLAWKQAVQHFQATEGRLPKDHAEFMKIMNEHEISLGYIEEGQEFLYDPTPTEEEPWGTLYVVEATEQPAQ